MADILTPIKSSGLSQLQSLRLTPSNSPSLRSPLRSPIRIQNAQSILTLKTIIGTTSSTTNAFASHEESRCVAYCAGSAVVLAELDDDYNVSQRFYKARPTAPSVNPSISYYEGTQTSNTPERRRKSIAPPKSGSVTYSPSASPTRDWIENGGSKTWTSRERTKAATAVSISADGRFLAVGETGYNPRVMIFSTAADAPHDIPVSILTEHSFGIRAVAFSPNTKYLATLGDANDGFLFIWAVNSRSGSARLLSTNKCTAFVNDMSWMGNNVVTVGTRHVKVWRVLDGLADPPSPVKANRFGRDDDSMGSPSLKALSGRNCLLGSLMDAKFTCVTCISASEAVVCTARGEVCLVDDSEGQQRLTVAKNLGYKIQCAVFVPNDRSLWFGGKDGRIQEENVEHIRQLARNNRGSPLGQSKNQSGILDLASPSSEHLPSLRSRKSDLLALASILGRLVMIDADHTLSITSGSSGNQASEALPLQTSLPAHRTSVQGLEIVKNSESNADFVTWSSDGDIRCWNSLGLLQSSFQVELEQFDSEEDGDMINELKVVRSIDGGKGFVTGDRYGVVRVLHPTTGTIPLVVRAHGAEVTDIAVYKSTADCLVATSGRDRIVQVFSASAGNLELIQTIDNHVGAVNNVLFARQGQKLLSGSADRTIIVHDRIKRTVPGSDAIAFLPAKVVTFKASPLSLALVPGEQDSLIVTTMNHQVIRLDLTTGVQEQIFKAGDSEMNDLVVLNNAKVWQSAAPGQSRYLIGISTTDKSIRVYDIDQGQLVTREFGHTEGVTDVAIVQNDEVDNSKRVKVVTTGLDATIMIWEFSLQQDQVLQDIGQGRAGLRGSENDGISLKGSPAMRPPMRRVLSRSELAEYMVLDPSNGSPVRSRPSSPPRIKRKSSKPNISGQLSRVTGSPSPPPPLPTIPSSNAAAGVTKQKSPTSTWNRNRSPSPPPLPQSPKTPSRGNTARLRRPPSVQSNLRSIARTKSSDETPTIQPKPVESIPENAKAAGEQLCTSLKMFRKKLLKAAGDERPDDGAMLAIEQELSLTVELVRRQLGMPLNADDETCSADLDIPQDATVPTAASERAIPASPSGSKDDMDAAPQPTEADHKAPSTQEGEDVATITTRDTDQDVNNIGTRSQQEMVG